MTLKKYRVLLTPELAKKWLSTTSEKKRPVRRGKVKKFASDMKNGLWLENGDTFCFDVTGALCNGIHRCTAVVESGVSMMVDVVEGLSLDAVDTIDIGTPRNVLDRLRISGHSGASGKASSALNVLLKIKLKKNDGSVDSIDLKQSYEKIGAELEESYKKASALLRAGGKKEANAFEIAAYYLFRNAFPKEEVDLFFEKLYSGFNCGQGSSYGKVKSRLIAKKSEIQHTRDHIGMLYLIARLWRYPYAKKWSEISETDKDLVSDIIEKLDL
jgi:hypothetical protein